MNQQQDRHDRELQSLFSAARRADEAETPAYASLIEAPPPERLSRLALALRVAALTAGVGVLAVAAAAPFFLLPGLQNPVDVARQQAVEEPVVTPVVTPLPVPVSAPASTSTPTLTPAPAPPAPAPKPVAKARADDAKFLENEPPSPSPPPAPRVTPGPDRGLAVAVGELPVPGRTYTNVITVTPGVKDADGDGNPIVHGGRTRDFSAIVGGVRDVDPLTGQHMNTVNPNCIEEMEVITSGAAVEMGRAQGGFARIEGGVMPAGTYSRVPIAPEEVAPYQRQSEGSGTESYRAIDENPFRAVVDHPLSTFSADVDTASYANVRRFLRAGRLPPADAVRVEEFVNYFRYDYPAPRGGEAFRADVEVASCPWNPAHRLARIGIRAREIERSELAGSNLVFLIDVSGSMDEPAKLPLLRHGLRLLTDQLGEHDSVAVVVYAGRSGTVLEPTRGSDRGRIHEAIERLEAAGSTNGGEGIRLAYRIARENFVPGGVNRVILATDGDFNVGVTSHSELLDIVREDARAGVFLTVLGFGGGNLHDDRLEQLADEGNGNYAYIDSLDEARRVLVEQVGGTLVTIAKDVKLQVEFNPAEVEAYRLIGYENRTLAREDFNDDAKDAGEIGAGHTVTALYELVPAGQPDVATPPVDPLRYQVEPRPSDAATSGELFTLKIRYKEPEGDTSAVVELPVADSDLDFEAASPEFRLASGAALFGMLLRGSEQAGGADAGLVLSLVLDSRGAGGDERRVELATLVETAATLLARK